MPDAHGNFKGISLPSIPWHSEDPDETVESADLARRFVEGDLVNVPTHLYCDAPQEQ